MTPLVSCIMPTRNRPEWARGALRMFLEQTWPKKELVAIGDGAQVFEGEAEHFIYIHLPRKVSIGMKRNLAVEMAAGEIVCHWDDDDTYAPTRIEDQVKRMLAAGGDVTGYHTMDFRDERDGSIWRYQSHRPNYAIGVSLMYSKRWWRRLGGFPPQDATEDSGFSNQARNCVEAGGQIIARIHAGNTCNKGADAIANNPSARNNWTRIA